MSHELGFLLQCSPVKSESIDVLIIYLEENLYGEVQFEGGDSAGI